MGCASSSPMVATAGSDMLKAATHVASDAAKGAENAVGEVTDTVGKTLESTKETVGTAVTGIAHDLSSAFTEKANELDTAKNELLERLHLAGETDEKPVEQTSETSTNHLDTKALEAASRLPTPPPDFDDSLKTSTNETENEHGGADTADVRPPTRNATIAAELDKLTTEVKQTNVEGLATSTVTEGIAEAQHALAEVSTGLTAATEPAVELIALLAAEKRPGTTEWEKHADNLSKTRKRNAFKGGGKFRRFGPAAPQIQSIHPANYILPIEPQGATERVEKGLKNLIKNSLLEDDSTYSDVYYNSRSSSPYSTSSNSPRVRRRRLRLPTNSVLAMNAKHMQRELAALLSDRRSAVRSLTVSPALRRRFDYNRQRVRYTSPTPPAMIGYSTPPIVIQPELLPLARTTNWKRSRENTSLSALPVHIGSANSASPPLNNVIKQSKIKPTKAFAPLRGQTTNERSRIFGQTRTGSPQNRRVFATRRSGVSQATNEARFIPIDQTNSPLRTRTLIQEKIENAKRAEREMTQPPTLIKLERVASIKEEKAPSIAEMVASGFSLSQALSPIKRAAESHSLPHLSDRERKLAASTPHSLVEVVEQAVERSKSGESRARTEVKSGEVKRDEVREKTVGNKSQKQDKTSVGNNNQAHSERSTKAVNTMGINGTAGAKEKPVVKTPTRSEIYTTNSNTSSGRGKNQAPISTAERAKNQGSSPFRTDIKDPQNSDRSAQERSKTSSGPGVKEKRSAQSANGFVGNDTSKVPGKVSSSSSRPEYKKRDLKENLSKNSYESSSSGQTHLKTWKGSDRSNSGLKYSNISNRFETLSKTNISIPTTQSNLRSTQDENNDSTLTSSETDESDFGQTSGHISGTSGNIIHSTETTEEYETNSPTRTCQRNGKSWDHENHKHENKSSEQAPKDYIDKTIPRENQSKTQKMYSRTSLKSNTPNPQNTARKTDSATHKNSQIPHSLHSSPSRSSMSSTSIVIGTIRSTPETEVSNDGALPKRLFQEFVHHYETVEEVKLSDPETEYYKDVETLARLHKEFKRHRGKTIRSMNGPKEIKEEKSSNPLHEDLLQQEITSNYEEIEAAILSTTETEDTNEFEAIEATILSTTETEETSDFESPEPLYEGKETAKDSYFSQISVEESGETAAEEHDSADLPVLSSSTDFDEPVSTKISLRPPDADENTVIYAASSLEDLIKLLPPQTAYLKMGRSATMFALRSTTPILDDQSLSYRSTPQRRRYKRHSACDGYHDVVKAPFVTELSSVARSRSPLVPLSPYKIRARCAVCYNKYVIK